MPLNKEAKLEQTLITAQLAGVVQYTDYISAEV